MKTRYHQILLPAIVFALSWSTLSTAQDAVSVDPRHHKVEFENDHVRVLRITFAPGESSQMHSHPCAIAVGVSDSLLTFQLPDGSTRPARLNLGQVIVAKPQTHSPQNKSPSAAEVILVELKDGGC